MSHNLLQKVGRSIIWLTLLCLCSCQSQSVIVTEYVKSATPTEVTDEITRVTSTSAVKRSTSANTATPVRPMSSKTATRTTVPSRTPTTTLTPMPELAKYFPGAKIVRYDDFNLISSYWYQKNAIAQDGLTITGTGSSWDSGISRRNTYKTNQGVAFRFSHDQGSRYEIFVENGKWNTSELKRFGIYCGMSGSRFQENTWQGTTNLSNYASISGLSCSPDTWYVLLLGIQTDGKFTIVIWEENKPQQPLVYKKDMNSDWENLNWVFRVGVENGNVVIDEFAEFQYTP